MPVQRSFTACCLLKSTEDWMDTEPKNKGKMTALRMLVGINFILSLLSLSLFSGTFSPLQSIAIFSLVNSFYVNAPSANLRFIAVRFGSVDHIPANWVQAASISSPRVLRTITVKPYSIKVFGNDRHDYLSFYHKALPGMGSMGSS